jgi:hypothetical protein
MQRNYFNPLPHLLQQVPGLVAASVVNNNDFDRKIIVSLALNADKGFFKKGNPVPGGDHNTYVEPARHGI